MAASATLPVLDIENKSAWVGVREAAELLGRHRTRVYELVRSGDLVADGVAGGNLCIERSSLKRWLVAGGSPGGPLTPRNAWAIIGLASDDDALCERSLDLLPRAEDASRARARLASQRLLALAPRLRRRATLKVVHVPPSLLAALEQDAAFVRTGTSAAAPYGWDELVGGPWALDAYIQADALRRVEASTTAAPGSPTTPVLLRAVDGLWPFPPHYQLTPQPLAALDLLDYPDEAARRRGGEVLRSVLVAEPTTIARRSARARAVLGPLVGKALGAGERPERRVGHGDPRTDTTAAAAHIVASCG